MSRPPNRSDAHLSAEDEAALEAEVREYYDDAAPKRHTKPSRSEHSAVYVDALVPDVGGNSHPELDKFQELEAHTEVSRVSSLPLLPPEFRRLNCSTHGSV
jgi:hypothetical protein